MHGLEVNPNTISYDTVLLAIDSTVPTDAFYHILNRAATVGLLSGFEGNYALGTASGWNGNLKFKATPLRLILCAGSLAKWHRSENLTGGLTPELLDIALGALDQELGLKGSHYSFRDARVLRIDMAANLELKYKPYNYIMQIPEVLNGYKKAERYTGKRQKLTGVTFRGEHRAVCIYDKLAEMREHRETIPKEFNNVLRIETRSNSPAGEWANIRAYLDRGNYLKLIDRWRDICYQLLPHITPPDMSEFIYAELELYCIGKTIKEVGLREYEASLQRAVEDGKISRKNKFDRLRKAKKAVEYYMANSGIDAEDHSSELREAITQAHISSAAPDSAE